MTIPALHRFADGRIEAMCGRCMAHSIAVVADGDAEAWAVLERLGWSVYSPELGVRSQSLCPACTTYPNTFAERVTKAPTQRKRR